MTTAADAVRLGLRYLTVQDVIWINTELTKRVQPFDYATLEEAVFFQYSYGAAQGVLPQAARFMSGLARLAPFAAGNAATAFVAGVAFLKNNGYRFNLSDESARGWAGDVFAAKVEVEQALRNAVAENEEHHHGLTPNVADAVSAAMDAYPLTIEALLGLG